MTKLNRTKRRIIASFIGLATALALTISPALADQRYYIVSFTQVVVAGPFATLSDCQSALRVYGAGTCQPRY